MKNFFISYNKADRRRAEWIAGVLEQAGFTTILAAWDFRPGSNFVLQMHKAASEAQRTLAVLSPDYLKALYTQPEWAAAFAQDPTGKKGKLILVKVRACVPKGLLAGIIHIDLVGLDDEAARDELLQSVRRLTARPRLAKRTGKDPDEESRFSSHLIMAPDIPAGFVERPAEFEQLLRLVLDDERERQTVAITTALHGSGGFGKTTLAAALCHDERVIKTFTDGILWVTLGLQPKVLNALTKLYATLTGERPAFVDEEDASIHLANELDTRKCLIVIDDVWQSAALRPFLRGGQRCVRLITTRDFSIAAGAQARRVLVDEMKTQEAVEMLMAGLKDRPRQAEAWRNLARRLGEWPLMLELARARLHLQMARGETLENALDYLFESLDRHGVRAFDHRNTEDRHEAISRTIEVSLELLDDEKNERSRYVELAIFPVATGIPLTAISALWGTDAFETEELVSRLSDLSVLKFNVEQGSIRLHDVLRSYLLLQLPDPSSTHKKLLGAWKDLYWLPDAYAWRWVGHHLVEANQKSALSDLLFDLEWMVTKIAVSDITALTSDYDYVDEPDARDVQAALRLMGHVLTNDKQQIAGQLVGRLSGGRSDRIQRLLEQANNWKYGFWLRPRTTTLRPPGGPLIRTLIGHRSPITAMSISTDGHRACSISHDYSIRMWDLNTGDMAAKRVRFVGDVAGIAPDGSRLLVLNYNNSIEVFDIESESHLLTLRGKGSWMTVVAVTADGTRAIAGAYDRLLKVWDLKNGTLTHTLQVQGRSTSAVAITPDGSRAISASRDEVYDRVARKSRGYPSSIDVWDVDKGERLHTLGGHTDEITALAITPNGTRAISASLDRTLMVWDLSSGTLLATLDGPKKRVTTVAITPDGRRAILSSRGHTVSVWDLHTGRVSYLRGHTAEVTAIATTVDSNCAISASSDGTLKVWDLNREELEYRPRPQWEIVDLNSVPEMILDRSQTRHGHSDTVSLISLDGMHVISASHDSTLKIWEFDNGALSHTLRGNGSTVMAMLLTPIGLRLITTTDRSWKFSGGHDLDSDKSADLYIDEPVERLKIGRSTKLEVWDLPNRNISDWGSDREPATGRLVSTLRGHRDGITAVALSYDGTRALTASADRTVKMWDVRTGQMLKTLLHPREVLAVTMTPDGRRALLASADSSLIVWDLDRGKLSYPLMEKRSAFLAVAITPDGKLAVSAGNHGLTVWDLETGQMVRTVEADSGGITAVAISDDGKRIAAAYDDHSLAVWDFESWKCVASFTSDAPVTSILIIGNSDIVAGDRSGQVHFLRLAGDMVLNH